MKQLIFFHARQDKGLRVIWMSFILIALISLGNLNGETRTASLSGNWSNTAIWGADAVPGASDDVVINTDVTVTMDVDATCTSVTTGTAALVGSKTLTTGVLTITQLVDNQNDVVFSIGSGTTLVCTSIVQVQGAGNQTVRLIVNGILKNSGSTSALTSFTCGSSSTVEYNGTGSDQTVFPTSYNNLTISGSGNKTLPETSFIISNNLSLSGSASVTTTKAITIGGNLDIGNGSTFTTSTNFTLIVTRTTSIEGTLTLAGSSAKTFTGTVTVKRGGTWKETGSPIIYYSGNLQNEGTFNANNGIHTFRGTALKTINGTNAIGIPNLTIDGITTNNGTLTVSTMLAGSSTLINGATGVLNIGATSGIDTLTAIAPGNTVNYTGAAQTVKATTYNNLTLSGSATKTTTDLIVNGILSMEGTATATAAPSYGPDATLQYKTSDERDIGPEWTLTPFTLTGGITIDLSSGTINLSTARTIASGSKLNLVKGTLAARTYLTMNSNSTINRSGGIITGTLKESGAYNVNYTGDSKNTGPELTGSGLNDLTVNLTDGQTLTLAQSRLPNGNLTISRGIFDLSSFTINRSSSGGILEITNGASLKIGGTETFPANYSIHTLGETSTVYYNGANQTITSDTYGNLTISGTGTKTITAGSEITVNGALTSGGMLAINSDATNSGSLIVNGTSNGNVTYNRWLLHANTNPATTPGYSRWHITSAPVAATGFNNTSNANKIHVDATPNLYDFATYSESENDWQYDYSATAATNLPGSLTLGKGYLISLKPSSNGIIQFTGELNNGDVNPQVSSSHDNGWNAVGNPYTSAMKVIGTSGFLEVNTVNLNPHYAAIYVWNEDATYTGNEQFYKVIGSSGYTPSPVGLPLGSISAPNIQAGQGFMIHSNGASSTVTFNKDMQVHSTGLSLKSAEVSWPGITLLAQSHGQTRSTVVAFNEQMTSGLDVSYDAGLLASDVFQVYTHLVEGANPVDFAIQCLPDNQYKDLSVPVGLNLPEGGELVFKASGVILPQNCYPVIEDKLLNIKTALKTETERYMVILDKNTSGTGRFYLSVQGIGVGTTEQSVVRKFTASFVNNQLVLFGKVELGTKATLYDISGRKLGDYPLENLNRNEIRIPGKSQGVYLLKIEGKSYGEVLKVVGR